MTLPASGSISIADIATELGVGLPLSLTASNVRALAGVPSGNIVLPNDFWGKSNVTITAANYDAFNIGFAVYALGTDGVIYDNASPIGDWVAPTSAASGCEVYAVLVGGSFLDAPAFDTWLALTTERSWSNTGTAVGIVQLSFRYNGGSTLKTIQVSVTSENVSP